MDVAPLDLAPWVKSTRSKSLLPSFLIQSSNPFDQQTPWDTATLYNFNQIILKKRFHDINSLDCMIMLNAHEIHLWQKTV